MMDSLRVNVFDNSCAGILDEDPRKLIYPPLRPLEWARSSKRSPRKWKLFLNP